MKRTIKILCFVSSLFFLLAGASYAGLIDELSAPGGVDYVFLEPDVDEGGPFVPTLEWATLNVQLDLPAAEGDPYTYYFQLANTGEYEEGIRALDLPVVPDSVIDFGQSDPPDGTPYDIANIVGEYLDILWMFEELAPGETSATIWLTSLLEPGEGIARITDTGQDSEAKAASALISAGGGPGTVPEPATLLLLGSGLIGIGAVRYLRSKKSA